MGDLSSLRANVGGAGVFGLAIALTLARRGAQVVLADPAPQGTNASAVAAGMLAPALEAALDPLAHGRFLLLEEARDLWPADGPELDGLLDDFYQAAETGRPRTREARLGAGGEPVVGGSTTATAKLALKAGSTKAAKLSFTVPAELPAGTYFVSTHLDGTSVGDTNAANDDSASTTTITVA